MKVDLFFYIYILKGLYATSPPDYIYNEYIYFNIQQLIERRH